MVRRWVQVVSVSVVESEGGTVLTVVVSSRRVVV
jgi:hypothetical protein